MVSNKRFPIQTLLLGAMVLPALASCGDDEDDARVSSSDAGEPGEGGTSTGGRVSTGGRMTGGTSTGGNSTGGRATGGTGMGGTTGDAGDDSGGDAGEDTGGTGGGGAGMGGTGGSGGMEFDGQEVFRFDTFGDEQLWTDQYRLHEAIQAALDPTTALSLGLKVDAAAVPADVLATADLTSPATTVALIGLDAVVGVKGTVEDGVLTRVGITCALCHSDVDDSVMPGIGMRIDGQGNRDLNPGAIIALSPGLADNADALAVLNSWGPGKYDPRWNQDGINHPVVIPSIYGLQGVPVETYTGDGPISYWNAYVGITQMGGVGNFVDQRIDVAVMSDEDLITPKLPALLEYQLSLVAPEPAAGSFDAAAAARGKALFDGAATCNRCHSGPTYSDAGQRLHAPEETGMEPVTAERSATGMYRTTPLRALVAHPPYFHDGSAATLAEVVAHYDAEFEIGLTPEQEADLVQYLNSL
jgi:cytochrome c5